ncbi:hypothetical protein SAMN02745121_08633 [Nannocystis exedens]|uniref:Uncharacterized protein n=1 Tax=Nannocystis exedens TaxID=54 RepID=A0A1I2ID80_9BACT|nr:hypothetical protein [Nannocystis exedens]PCC68228.1 hypothetical protein NAEX_01238 [Nannocystis exedens]SFF40332.1 hypothetical protein SAMN02745121_08633 [Nannocystis exedens]
MSRVWITLGTALGVVGVGGALLYSRRASAASLPPSAPEQDAPPPAVELPPLPRARDVKGDLSTNWGETPVDLRPLFMLMEEVAKIPGSSRVFAVIAYRESRFVTTAHNGNATGEQDERDSSRRAYDNNKERNPPLRYGEAAANFGSGGLFGLLAPYFLWTGVPEVGKQAPLLNASPELLFQPRAAAFGAAVYMQRILKNYRIDDIADIKVGWANPSLLGSGRGGTKYHDVRVRFLTDAVALNVDLTDATTIPPKLDASAWPGVLAVFAGLVGALPKELA